MANIRGIRDFRNSQDSPSERYDFTKLAQCLILRTSSYTGGHRSGLAVENPDEGRNVLKIRCYRNGFVVNSGPFRSLDVEDNRHFMDEVRAGRVPAELYDLVQKSGGELQVSIVDEQGDFPSATAASTHQRPVVTATSNTTPTTTVDAQFDIAIPVMDLSDESTSIQFRLPSGQRVVRKFNQSQQGSILLRLISDAMHVPIAQVIISSGFPPRPVNRDALSSKTLKELGLCDSTVFVTLC